MACLRALVRIKVTVRVESFAWSNAVSDGFRRTPRLLSLYEQYLDSQDTLAFVGKVSQSYTQGTLQRLAESSEDCRVRRAAVLALGFLGDYEANGTMGRALQDSDRTVRLLAENGIRNVWLRIGSESQRQQLALLVRLNAAQRYDEAIKRASELIRQAPWLAEAWNQRAIAEFALGRHEDAARDCHQTLEINPYHFAAAAGLGQAYLHLNSPLPVSYTHLTLPTIYSV